MTLNHTDMKTRSTVLNMFNPDHPKIWTITRNGRVYDRLNPDTHSVLQIARSLADDMPRDVWQVWNDQAEMVYTCGPVGSLKGERS